MTSKSSPSKNSTTPFLDGMINYDDLADDNMKCITLDKRAPSWPFRGLVVGESGSGKTNFVMNVIMRSLYMDQLYVFAADIEEHKYKTLEKWCALINKERMKKNKELQYDYEKNIRDGNKPEEPNYISKFNYMFSDSIDDIPDPESLEETKNEIQTMILIDDFVLAKHQEKFEEYYIRGRKKNASVIYLSQSLPFTPSVIKKNLSWIILFATQSKSTIMGLSKSVSDRYTYNELIAIMDCVLEQPKGANLLIFDKTKPLDYQWRIGYDFDKVIPRELRYE